MKFVSLVILHFYKRDIDMKPSLLNTVTVFFSALFVTAFCSCVLLLLFPPVLRTSRADLLSSPLPNPHTCS